MRILYEMALWLLALVSFPALLYKKITKGKYKHSFWRRFGYYLPPIEKNGRSLIWLHAGSVGETKAIVALAKQIKATWKDAILLVSSTTETGHAEAKRSLAFADYHIYLPFDFQRAVNPMVSQIAPSLVVLAESDIWFNFLAACREHGALIAVVNGKISERSTNRFQKLPFFATRLMGFVDLFAVQNELYKQRFLSLGVPKDKIIVTGNMKFDDQFPALSDNEIQEWKSQLGIKPSDQVLVVGSTHDPEEKLFIDTLKNVWQSYPQLKVLIVPRHPERFPEVAKLLAKEEVPFIRYSEVNNKTGDERVILMDAMGLLKKSYQLADIAFVAGSYTSKVGGHNILEPCGYGKPVLFGTEMHSQPELVAVVKEYQAGLQVPYEKLSSTLIELLDSAEKRTALGEKGRTLMNEMQGATQRTWKALQGTMT